MDLDRDGFQDVITGSWPGELYVFRGQEDGTFTEATKLKDESGEIINLGSASAVYVADWDADGDLDLVVGDQKGHVWWLPNGSGGETMEFGAAEMLKVGGEEIRVPHGDSGPCLADWDGNGTLDLIVGCGDGSVRLYPNLSTDGMPMLEPHVDLLEKPAGGMSLKHGDQLRTGARAKPHVTDWNGDGMLDLLVGDVLSVRPKPKVLTPEQQAEHDRLQAKMVWVQQRYGPASQRVMERAYRTLGVVADGRTGRDLYDALTDEQRERLGPAYQEAMKKDIEAQALQRMLQETSRAMQPYRARNVIHGHVWVLLRREPAIEAAPIVGPLGSQGEGEE